MPMITMTACSSLSGLEVMGRRRDGAATTVWAAPGSPQLLFHVTASYPCLPQGALLGLGAGCSDVVPHQPLLAFLLVLLSLLLSFFLSALIRKLYAPQLGFVRDAKDVTEESQLG